MCIIIYTYYCFIVLLCQSVLVSFNVKQTLHAYMTCLVDFRHRACTDPFSLFVLMSRHACAILYHVGSKTGNIEEYRRTGDI